MAIALVGCGGGPSCKDAVGKAAKRFGAQGRSEVTTLIGTCEQDSWSAGTRACFAGAETADKLEDCLPAPDYKKALPPVEPSDATRKLVAKAGKDPVKALLFLDPKNEVGAIVRTYFDHLGLATEQHDRFIEAKLAQRYKVYKDGLIVLVRGDRSYTVEVHPDLVRVIETGELEHLDREVAVKLGRLVRPVPRAYLVAGHGEITDPGSRPADTLGTIPERRTTALTRGLELLGLQVAPLPAVQLAKDVPADATVVLWLGPITEPRGEEWAALGRYVDRGGHLLVALDPLSHVGLGPLEQRLGVRFVAEHLADDKSFLPQRHTASDHAFVVTDKFLAHPSTAMLTRAVDKGMVLIDPGRLERLPAAPAGVKVTPTIQTRDTTFVDANHSYALDGDEKRGVFDVAVAVERDKLRAAVFADVDMFADAFVNSASGSMSVVMVSGPLLGDTLRWLGAFGELQPELSSKDKPARGASREVVQEIERRRAVRRLARSLADKGDR